MSCLVAPEIRCLARSEVARIDIDWGENTSGEETGALKAGDTVASAVVIADDMPAGATTPTLGAVTVNVSALYVNGRSCSAGEATTFQITALSNQTYGEYRLKVTATTTNGYTLPRYIRISVTPPE